jgi:predicted acyl esterase
MRMLRLLLPLVLLAGLAVGPAGAAPIPPLSPATSDRYQALPLETIMVPTRGGDVYVGVIRPDVPAGTTVPVILTYTPYQLFLESADDGLASYFVPKGYARALAHVVGTGNSGGCWDYGAAASATTHTATWSGSAPEGGRTAGSG